MPEPDSTQPKVPSTEAHPTGAPPVGAILDATPAATDKPSASVSDSTVGTGTSIALGCVLGTVVLIIFGLIFLGIVALIN